MSTCTKEQFLKDIRNHVMKVIKDDGIHRHLLFKKPNGSEYWFEIVTWPGRLCIAGDMGDHVFARLSDMFEFFRTDRTEQEPLRINLGYWSEKLQATAKDGGFRKFSKEKFEANVRRRVEEYFDEEESAEVKEAVLQEIEDDVLPEADEGAHAAYTAAMGYSHEGSRFSMHDFYESNCDEYTYHFEWCCYAIAWGIRQYDEAKNLAAIRMVSNG